MNEEVKLRFRKIFVVEPSHDIRALSQYTENVTFVCGGKEDVKNIPLQIENTLSEFDPATDAIVPVGRVITTMLAGIYLGTTFKGDSLYMGVYRDGDYTFVRVDL
jgi:hypothetical protein